MDELLQLCYATEAVSAEVMTPENEAEQEEPEDAEDGTQVTEHDKRLLLKLHLDTPTTWSSARRYA